ncbi:MULTISPECIES: DUF3784 domain-containing protein [unclassified Breznakia]|uniref:DUF3784 domain-containing protein n=1 Tax=unclassified Breznakia TaxID=2623764 RepID=UPI0024763A8F|nr:MULTISPECIES: DUF3784 domain-containing protein [unclassified Breznakia]MDH6368114.1 Mg2+/Co2+ transporter CorB [Breznakia sp. PH1-1]MDH6405203.1 Mg2+/Co2+ transporter CorB [Breznakia sp. PF1-11]MDH6412917.1 Mg2+/Co2+ transporter CorB [Breznakia sp. PFB1-11]MDH6415279.1 Mg2+/Co2+ transporter CorB [Breznakia sp. PFB1-14]MDH6417588.1 Mg2+/Co2+ transporter CorB [Breznakia sp. PFB1-4]
MNDQLWISWVLVVILVIISFILLMGKGGFLIAGYNMQSKEKKQKYNAKRLCRVVGGGTSIISVILTVATLYRFEMPLAISWIIPWGLFGIIVIVGILANTICWRKTSTADE